MSDEKPLLFSPPLSTEEIRKRTKISEEFFTVFSNHVRVAVSQPDIRIFVGENYPTADGEIAITELLCVAMTPQQAKATLNLLTETLSAYERSFGEIKPLTTFPASSPTAQPTAEKSE